MNVYTPGNTLSLHRDVSEACDAGLVSVSFGCDAMMVMTGAENDAKNTVAVLRLKSGDVLFMDGPARWAWHGIPHVLPGTCPEYLKNWPARSELAGEVSATEEDPYRPWRAWMADKRINLNVRQVWPSPVSQAGSESTTDGTVPC